jgi:DNA (cytosine-5)-methyltransferase 1
MRFGSVCSGIEAASVAWHPLGWQAAWLAEIEPFPSALLAHHYPGVPNLGDMTKLADMLHAFEIEAPDVFCGGTPCQAFSVAGLRKSLDDARGNLSLTFCEIANAIDTNRAAVGEQPCIVFWENVPGVLNTKDNAFGCFLAGLAGEDDPLEPPGGRWTNAGYVSGPQRTVAWRILDAQYFGVAQRRRRVFVVASAREGFDPAAVLFEFEGVRRDTAPSRSTGQEATGTIEASLGRSRGAGTPTAALTPDVLGCEFGPSGGRFTDLNPTLDTRAKDGPIRNQLAGAVLAMAHGQGGAEIASERSPTITCNYEAPIGFIPADCLPFDTTQITSPQNGSNPKYGDPCHPIAAGAHAPAVAFGGDIARTLQARHDSSPCADRGMDVVAVTAAFKGGQGASAGGIGYDEHVAPTLSSADSGSNRTPVALTAMQVRRLTPVECERLQGFPDGYTDIKPKGKPTPDGPRYKALGNSWAVPNVRWIGERIQREVDGGAK